MIKANYQIPFDEAGNQMSYPESWREIEWRENSPFIDTLTYKGYSRGRSAANIEFERSDGASVSFFMVDFHHIAPKMAFGCITGLFQFVKRGQNYGCQLVDETA